MNDTCFINKKKNPKNVFRGQESAGIAMSAGDNHTHFSVKKGMGLISNIFNDEAVKKLKGNITIHIIHIIME